MSIPYDHVLLYLIRFIMNWDNGLWSIRSCRWCYIHTYMRCDMNAQFTIFNVCENTSRIHFHSFNLLNDNGIIYHLLNPLKYGIIIPIIIQSLIGWIIYPHFYSHFYHIRHLLKLSRAKRNKIYSRENTLQYRTN